MEFHVITLFPELFAAANWPGMVGRALKADLIKIEAHALREHGLGNYRQIDDTPYGGGSGMVLRPEPLFAAIESTLCAHPGLWRVLLTPQGEPLDQSLVRELSARRPGLLLVAGRYEGVDERVRSQADQEISIGDFVLSGGELPAAVVIDATARLIAGVLGNENSAVEESFGGDGMLECPQYTRPAEFRGWSVPEVLVGGNHEEIRKWRQRAAAEKTARVRPDLVTRSVGDKDNAKRSDDEDPEQE
jgi:tRNA (guanine37-N1)-methyltransferase